MQKIFIFCKKHVKYIGIILLAGVVIGALVLRRVFQPSTQEKDKELMGAINHIKDSLQVATLEAKVAAVAAHTKDDALKKQLKEVVAIKGPERVNKLAELAKRG